MTQYDVACTVPERLSRVALKRELYAGDPYYRDAWDDLRAMRGVGPDTLDVLHRATPLVLRPDALAARGGTALLAAARAAGFVPVAWETFAFDRHTTRELWRYQLNIATRERIDVMDMVMPKGKSLYVLLRDERPSAVPASTRLSTLKGPSRPEDREPHHLRYLAGPAQASVLTYVHVSDEPADLVRELGIFFDRPQRRELITALDGTADVTDEVLAALRDVEAGADAADLLFEPALARLSGRLGGRADTAELATLLRRIGSGDSRDWQAVLALADHLGIELPHWDRVAIAAELSARHLDADPVIPDVGRSSWQHTQQQHEKSGETMAEDRVTVERLAEAKMLPAEALRRFGLSDGDEGVRFAYTAPDGTAGRTRLRTGMRGAGGSSWLPGDESDVVAYSTRQAIGFAETAGYQIVVEGESDCWTAWHHGIPAVGIPGSGHWDALSAEHLPVAEVFVQVEADSAQTYPGGVDRYVASVVARIRELGFTGDVHELRLGGGFSDLSELYQSDPSVFPAAVARALDGSRAGAGTEA
ncbi:hypothetical protein AB0F25_09575 [Streptomyces wedmorensis]|uniref:hypothetical protein n=1 Tax=Streptomyces wedmorensis TaxID=43759 RepID=UPI003437722F